MENVKVTEHSSFEHIHNLVLSWEHKGARYHIWENDKKKIIYKNPPNDIKYGDVGYFRTGKLNSTAKANAPMLAEARRIAVEQGLYEKAADDLRKKKEDEENQRLASIALQQKKEAAEEMYEALMDFPMLLAPATTAWGKQVQEWWQEKAHAALAKAEGR